MADEKELSELRERIGRLSGGDQTWLLEMVLVDNRRRHKELVAEMLAAQAELLEFERRQRESNPAATVPPEAKREAG